MQQNFPDVHKRARVYVELNKGDYPEEVTDGAEMAVCHWRPYMSLLTPSPATTNTNTKYKQDTNTNMNTNTNRECKLKSSLTAATAWLG